MWHPHRRAGTGVGHLIRRRDFLRSALALLLWQASAPARADGREDLDPGLVRALVKSRFVYISPLRSDGSESRCHAELWFAWLDGAVVVITSASGWKARSLGRGLDRARIWVGDHGRWKRLLSTNEEFRRAPSFDARARVVRDAGLLDRVLASFETRYPEEIGAWRERMRRGFEDGSRVLIRYVPEPARSSRT